MRATLNYTQEDVLEHMHMTRERPNIYTVLEDLDFTFDLKEVRKAESLWKLGVSIQGIATVLDRDCDEVALLIMDRARKNHIKRRPDGIFARRDRA